MMTQILTLLLTIVAANNVSLNKAAAEDNFLSTFLPQNYDVANRIASFEARYDQVINQEINSLGNDTYELVSYAYLPGNDTSIDNHTEILSGEPALAKAYAQLIELLQETDALQVDERELTESFHGYEDFIGCHNYCNSPHHKCQDHSCPHCRIVGGNCRWQRWCV